MTPSSVVRRKRPLALLIFIALTLYLLKYSLKDPFCALLPPFATPGFCSSTTGREWNLFYHLGGNGPWIPKHNAVGNVYTPLPEGCAVDQVHVLARHAARYPTNNAGNRHLALLKRLRDGNVLLKGSLAFLENWEYFTDPQNPAFENLTRSGPYAGTSQAHDAGRELRQQYGHLLRNRETTRFWSCGSNRDIETAVYFADGFFGSHWQEKNVAELIVVPEDFERGADTLTPGDTCRKYRTDLYGHDFGYWQLEKWQLVFAPIIADRLRDDAPGFEFQTLDIYSMMEMCGFEILARGSSPWCDVFTQEEWLQFEYARDLLHFYRAGPGNSYAPTLAWPYLNATADLLMNRTTNDAYISFVHDGDIVPVLATLHILDEKILYQELPTDHVKENRAWRTSDVVPMGARVVLERIACTSRRKENDRYLRLVVNDGVVKMPGLASSKKVPYTVSVEAFHKFVRSRVDWYGTFAEVCGLAKKAPKRITFLHQ